MQVNRNRFSEVHQLVRSVGTATLFNSSNPDGLIVNEPARIRVYIEMWADGDMFEESTIMWDPEADSYRLTATDGVYVLLHTRDGEPIPNHRDR